MNFFYKIIADFYTQEEFVENLHEELIEIYHEIIGEKEIPEKRLLDKIGIDTKDIKKIPLKYAHSYKCKNDTVIVGKQIYYSTDMKTLYFYKTFDDFAKDNCFQSFTNITIDDLSEASSINIKLAIKKYKRDTNVVAILGLISMGFLIPIFKMLFTIFTGSFEFSMKLIIYFVIVIILTSISIPINETAQSWKEAGIEKSE